MRSVYQQQGSGVRFDWGPVGAASMVAGAGDGAAAVVVVDVLSFTTTVTVAVERGTAVLPYRWRDTTAAVHAKDMGAALAVGRSEVSAENPWSLSPASIRSAPFVERLVLPSPNGSAIASAAVGPSLLASSLRNGSAVASALHDEGYGSPERPVLVVAAGERWGQDGSLRPAIEDLYGAGQVCDALSALGASLSPEAIVAARTWREAGDPIAELRASASACELVEDGFPEDVDEALGIDVSCCVPRLVDGAFVQRTAVRS